jgi:CRISPR/Cas system-associated endonuclease Cas1
MYVNTQDKTYLTADGPQLVIFDPQNRQTRVPVRDINTVQVRGRVLIDSAAIFLLADNDIPIVISKTKTGKNAMILPYNHYLPKYHKEQRIILKSNQNIDRYMKWLETQRMYQQINVMNKISPSLQINNQIGEGNYQQWLKGRRPQKLSSWQAVKRSVRLLFRGVITEKLIKAKLDLHLGGYFRRVNFGLVLDLALILDPKVDEQCLLFFRQKSWADLLQTESDGRILLSDAGHKNVVHRFENKKKELGDEIERIIDDYFSFLRELRI